MPKNKKNKKDKISDVELNSKESVDSQSDESEEQEDRLGTPSYEELTDIKEELEKSLLRANADLDNSLKRYDFGYSMLSEHVGGINLRQLAIDTGFVSPPLNEGDDVIPPSPEQLDAFLKDVSIMCTPAELQQQQNFQCRCVCYSLCNQHY